MLTELRAGCSRICEVYVQAPERWAKKGVKTISVDEKTGMQALERNAPDLPLDIGKTRKREFEYTRHGTQCLLANWDVVRSGIICPTIGDTRNEEGFQRHIQKPPRAIPPSSNGASFWITSTPINPRHSVRWIAAMVGTEKAELGEKGKNGILKNMESRAAFWSNPTHPVYFVYTPKHCSWLHYLQQRHAHPIKHLVAFRQQRYAFAMIAGRLVHCPSKLLTVTV